MASEGVPAELVDEIKRVIAASFSAPADDYTEIVEETANPEVYEDVDRDTYIEAMEEVFNEYDVPQPMREQVYEQLDAQGEYTPEGYIQNLTVVINDNDIHNAIDNSLTVEHGAEVHGDITQQNDTNVANASGEGAIAGRDQEGQFQTGDGVQVGDDNSGVVNQGDNSGQQAGYEAHADDITTGDGNFNNEGQIDDSAIAFGGGAADNTANELDDHSTNDSFNTEHSYNEEGSYNTQDSYNTEETYTETATVDANLDADVDHSFNSDDDYKDVDDSHNVHEAEEVGYE